jgi:pilus assembly protein Flp/PilA
VRPGRDGQSGQGMVEYGLILVLVALVVVVALTTLGRTIPTIFNNIVNTLKSP